MKKLKTVSEQHDLYSRLYRQYVSDLTKTVIYIRELIAVKAIEAFLKSKYPKELTFFREIIRNEYNPKG